MSRMLAELMGAEQTRFARGISDLENATGMTGIDVRLTADIVTTASRKLRELGLDPVDTSPRELYHALYNLAHLHDTFLARRLEAADPTDTVEMITKVIKAVKGFEVPKQAWLLKHSAAKRLLKAHPPKNLMKSLGYRSIDSMLKREQVADLLVGLRYAETQNWVRAFFARYATLSPSDFEIREVEVTELKSKRWEQVTERIVRHNRHNVTHIKELGAIIVLPLPVKHMNGITLTLLPLLIHYINEIRHYSAYLKLQQVKKDFGLILAESLSHDPAHHAVMAGHKLHWRVIARRYGKLELNYHPEVFEPHVMPEDLHFKSPGEILYRLEPALHFWNGLEYVGMAKGGAVVSMNIMDMALNLVNRLSYGYHLTYHMRDSLHHELLARYLARPNLEAQVLNQLTDNYDEPDMEFTMTGVLV